MRTICILDKGGKVIASEPAKSNARRHSMQGAADQRQLDALHTQNPTGVKGEIRFDSLTVHFDFVGGRSQWVEK